MSLRDWLLAVIFAICSTSGLHSLADEGMIPINQLAQLNLNARGLELPANEIFDPDQVCLIDGICRVNGCTGSFVSAQGLIITNHHCAYGAIQTASTTEHDFLANGFQAATFADEIPATGYTVRITEGFSDISSQVLRAVEPQMSFLERTQAIERRRKELEKQAESEHPGMRAEVAEMFTGKTYLLFLYTYLKDVRLVFAPPASIGNFGGEVDNWEWPRHTGDFSFMRAYTAPDGSSADYSPNNVPYKPKRVIEVAPQGANEGDFVFILGYPGKTARHKTASFVDYEQQVRLPFITQLYAWQIGQLEAAGKDDRAVALKLAAQIRSLANVEKRARGQLQGLKRADIAATRRETEARLQEFIQLLPERRSRYEHTLSEIDTVYAELTQAAAFELNIEALSQACRTLMIAGMLVDAAHERTKDDLQREPQYMDRNFDQTLKTLRLAVNDLYQPVDVVILTGLLERLRSVPQARSLPGLSQLISGNKSMETGASRVVTESRLHEMSFFEKCAQLTPEELAKIDDPALELMLKLYPTYQQLRQLNKERNGKLDKAYGDWVDIKQQFMEQSFIPDANATLRLTYGRIRGYSPQDGIIKTPVTTLKGVIDKTTGVDPFITPERVVKMYQQRDFGPFVHPKLQQVPVAILYDTDTTGGNSGSPVMNSRGQLIGVNFDRAFEATINDFAWNDAYSRSIGVDIRYCLWITGKVYGAEHLLREMGVK